MVLNIVIHNMSYDITINKIEMENCHELNIDTCHRISVLLSGTLFCLLTLNLIHVYLFDAINLLDEVIK